MQVEVTANNRIILAAFVISVLSMTFFAISAAFANETDDGYETGLVAYSQGNFAKAAENFRRAAEAGDAGAQHMLMRMYSEGKGVSISANLTHQWTKNAAEQGVVAAQFALAEQFHTGAGTEQNLKKAFFWYEKAANNGYHKAKEKLAAYYEHGTVVSQNQDKARSLYLYAASEYDVFAQKGDPESQNALALMYESGKGVELNIVLAMNWYRKAAFQNYAPSQFNLGRLLAEGEKVEQNIREAAYWLEQAANQGYPAAVEMLAELRETHGTTLAMR